MIKETMLENFVKTLNMLIDCNILEKGGLTTDYNLVTIEMVKEALSNKNLVIDLEQLFACIDYTDNFLMGLENYKKED